jgi:hypothetical protein
VNQLPAASRAPAALPGGHFSRVHQSKIQNVAQGQQGLTGQHLYPAKYACPLSPEGQDEFEDASRESLDARGGRRELCRL